MNKLLKLLVVFTLAQASYVHAEDVAQKIFSNGFEFCELDDAEVYWDNGGDGVSWFDPDNWSGDTLPVDGQNVSINSRTDVIIDYEDPSGNSHDLLINNLDSCNSISFKRGSVVVEGTAWVRRNALLAGAKLSISGSLRTGQFEQTGGNLSGLGTLNIDSLFTWSGGSQLDAGTTIANGGMTLSGSSHILTARTITLNSASTWSGGTVSLRQGATINNNAPWSIETDDDMANGQSPPSTLNNTSTITKTSGGGITLIQASFNNSGTITVADAELHLGSSNGSGVSTGDFVAEAGTILGIAGANDMTAASSFTGAGGLVMNTTTGVTVINGSYEFDGTLEVRSNSPGTLRFANGVTFDDDVSVVNGTLDLTAATTINGSLSVAGGTLSAASATSVSGGLDQSAGKVDGVGTITVTGPFTWSGGSQLDAGATIANGGMTLSGSSHFLTARTITLNSASTWSGGTVSLRQGATINNNAPWSIETDDDMTNGQSPPSTLNNTSTITKTSGGGITLIQASFNNSGTITVADSELHLGSSNGSGVSTGDFVAEAGTILGIAGANDMTAASSFTGAGGLVMNTTTGVTVINGSYEFDGTLEVRTNSPGTLRFANGVTFDDDVSVVNGTLDLTAATTINGSLSVAGGTLSAASATSVSGGLDQSAGKVDGVGTITVTGPFTWSGGSQLDAGATIANGGMTLSGSAHTLTARTITLNSASTWNGGTVSLRQGATINNNAPWSIETDDDMTNGQSPPSTLNNTSTITKTSGVGETFIAAILANSGTITSPSGTLNIDGVIF